MLTTLGTDMCREPRADAARELFQSRVFPDGRTLLIISRGQTQASIFPGGVVVIGSDALQAMQAPNELARLTTTLSAQSESTLDQLFESSSPRELFDYITSGKLSDERLAKVAQNIINGPEVDEMTAFTSTDQPLLRDQDWVSLQGICLE